VRVLLTSDFYPPAPGGLEAHVRRLAHGLIRAGDEVMVVTGGTSPPGDDGGVVVHHAATRLARLPGAYQQHGRAFHPPWPDRAFAGALADVLGRFRPDVVHAHGWCAFSAAAACAGRCPLVVTLHDYGLRCPKKNLLRGGAECADGRGLRCARCPGSEQGTAKRSALAAALAATAGGQRAGTACYIAVSHHVAERHLEAWRTPAQVDVIPNFLDVPPAAPPEPGESGVLYVGPADRHKGLHVLLDARRRLPARLARLVVVGACVATDAADGVSCPGRLTGNALWQRYREAALVVVPSIWPEPCPTVALEALAYGRPVVASRVGGLPDLVDDGRTGVLVPPGDSRALSSAISALLTDRAALCAMGHAARLSAAAFDTVAVVRRIQTVYEKVLAGWDPRRGPS
jgi:glycosyltransferase involved in cell wall biosynthesis